MEILMALGWLSSLSTSGEISEDVERRGYPPHGVVDALSTYLKYSIFRRKAYDL